MSLSRLRREARKAYSDPALISHGDGSYPYRCLGASLVRYRDDLDHRSRGFQESTMNTHGEGGVAEV